MDTKTKIENANAILSDKGNVIKTRDDRELIMVDKDGKVTNPDDCNWMPDDEIITKSVFRSRIEPWLTSLFQSEHLSLLCGSGITNSISYLAGASGGTTMAASTFTTFKDEIKVAAEASAKASGRKKGNLEDQIRTATIYCEG